MINIGTLREETKTAIEEWNRGDLSDGEMVDAALKNVLFEEYYPILKKMIIDIDGDVLTDYEVCQILVEIFWNEELKGTTNV